MLNAVQIPIGILWILIIIIIIILLLYIILSLLPRSRFILICKLNHLVWSELGQRSSVWLLTWNLLNFASSWILGCIQLIQKSQFLFILWKVTYIADCPKTVISNLWSFYFKKTNKILSFSSSRKQFGLKRFVIKPVLFTAHEVEQGNDSAYAQQEELRDTKELFKLTYSVDNSFSRLCSCRDFWGGKVM